MNQWLQFLTQQGALFEAAPESGSETNLTPDALNFGGLDGAVITDNFIAPLNRLGVIAASGEETARFLHNQLTNDVEHLTDAEARLAGYCSVKGRLLATFLIWKADDKIWLQLPSEILPALQKRLQMYVLRAKVKLTDVSAEHVILGLVGAKAAAALSNWFEPMPPAPYTSAHSAAGTLIRVADAGQRPRYQWITTAQVAQGAWLALARDLTPAGAAAWRLTEIETGVPQIMQATQEQFVPQMINYEVIGGVNFKKGCYPGQEIVARSQYLGKLKRRMQPASVAGIEARAGMVVFSSADPAQPCGMVVNAERSSAQQMECLVELKTAALDSAASIHLGAADGPRLSFGTLPYALPHSI